jgi:hypothetical protein
MHQLADPLPERVPCSTQLVVCCLVVFAPILEPREIVLLYFGVPQRRDGDAGMCGAEKNLRLDYMWR